MKTKLFFLLLPILALGGTAKAHSNFEDCILETMKNVKSDQAANLIYAACRSKYPEAKLPPPKNVELPRSGSVTLHRESGGVVGNVKISSWANEYADTKKYRYNFNDGPLRAYIKVTNKNDFGITLIRIGTLPNGVDICPSGMDGYELVYTCSPWVYAGQSYADSVRANESGIFECPDNVDSGFCIVSITTEHQYDVDAFLTGLGLDPTRWK